MKDFGLNIHHFELDLRKPWRTLAPFASALPPFADTICISYHARVLGS